MAHETCDSAKANLAGHAEVPKKEIHHISTRKAGKGYIHEHHHTHPEHHPMTEHTSADQDGMVEHMMQNMGQANPGEAEADAGQSGIQPQTGAPQPQAPMAGA
jgi:hypothetical protein